MSLEYPLTLNQIFTHNLAFQRYSVVEIENASGFYLYVALTYRSSVSDIISQNIMTIAPYRKNRRIIIPGSFAPVLSLVATNQPYSINVTIGGSAAVCRINEYSDPKALSDGGDNGSGVLLGDFVIVAGGNVQLDQTGVHMRADGSAWLDWLDPVSGDVVGNISADTVGGSYRTIMRSDPARGNTKSTWTIQALNNDSPVSAAQIQALTGGPSFSVTQTIRNTVGALSMVMGTDILGLNAFLHLFESVGAWFKGFLIGGTAVDDPAALLDVRGNARVTDDVEVGRLGVGAVPPAGVGNAKIGGDLEVGADLTVDFNAAVTGKLDVGGIGVGMPASGTAGEIDTSGRIGTATFYKANGRTGVSGMLVVPPLTLGGFSGYIQIEGGIIYAIVNPT